LKDVVDRFEQTDGRLLGIATDHASSNYLMSRELQSTLEASGIERPAFRNLIPCMAHVIQLASVALMRSVGVKGCTQSWATHEQDEVFRENEHMDIGRDKDFNKSAMPESIRCRAWEQVYQR